MPEIKNCETCGFEYAGGFCNKTKGCGYQHKNWQPKPVAMTKEIRIELKKRAGETFKPNAGAEKTLEELIRNHCCQGLLCYTDCDECPISTLGKAIHDAGYVQLADNQIPPQSYLGKQISREESSGYKEGMEDMRDKMLTPHDGKVWMKVIVKEK